MKNFKLSAPVYLGSLAFISLTVMAVGPTALYALGGLVATVWMLRQIVDIAYVSHQKRAIDFRSLLRSARIRQYGRAGELVLRELERRGAVFHGAQDMLPDANWKHDWAFAQDAQPALATVASGGIPAFLTMYVDPAVIKVLFAPMRAAEILGEVKKGDWLTETAMFLYVESTGQVSSYGDYSADGSSGANANFPQRQSYHYQTFSKWGEKEMERMGLARLDWVSQINIASALTLNKFQNKSYFFGIANLENYGLVNDPSLSASLSPTAAWSTANAEVIYNDVKRLFGGIVAQSNGNVEKDDEMTLIVSPEVEVYFLNTNAPYDSVNVFDLLKKGFPKMKVKSAPEFSNPLTTGEFVMLIVDSVQGQKTATTSFTEKMRSHAVVVDSSSWKQKKSQGTWGTVIFQPFAIKTMVGIT